MVTAQDADVGENARLTYSIEPTTEPGLFAIEPDSGQITWSTVLTNQTSFTAVCAVSAVASGVVVGLWAG